MELTEERYNELLKVEERLYKIENPPEIPFVTKDFRNEFSAMLESQDFKGIVKQVMDLYDSFCDEVNYWVPNKIELRYLTCWKDRRGCWEEDLGGYCCLLDEITEIHLLAPAIEKRLVFQYKGKKYAFDWYWSECNERYYGVHLFKIKEPVYNIVEIV